MPVWRREWKQGETGWGRKCEEEMGGRKESEVIRTAEQD